ncbi:MAG: diaminopimelate decarboxylase [Alphaproteobacteria bacterium]
MMNIVGFSERYNELWIEEVRLADIFRKYGSRTYVYSQAHIESQYDLLAGAMLRNLPSDNQPMLCYACKANSNINILRILKNKGSGLEVGSYGELLRGRAAGFDPNKIVVTGVGKEEFYIRDALKGGIHQFNIEALFEIETINKVAEELGVIAPVVFRLNPAIEGAGAYAKISTGGVTDKFGILKNYVFEAYEMAEKMQNVEALGLSMHIGSQVTHVEKFEQAFEKIPGLVSELREKRFNISRLDIGGGFPIQYKEEDALLDLDQYAQWVDKFIRPLDTEIIMEPGRFLVGNSGVLLTQVVGPKEAGDFTFSILDTGMTDLVRPAMYGARHQIEAITNRDAEAKKVIAVGQVCESSDVWGEGFLLPEGVRPGTMFAHLSAGAYGYEMGLPGYNTRGMGGQVLVIKDRPYLISKPITPEQIIANDIDLNLT